MAWNDPAPARGSRPSRSPSRSPSQSQSAGYGAANSLPFLTILGRGLGALFIGGVSGWAVHSAAAGWHAAHRTGSSGVSDMAIALAVAVVVGVLALRYLLDRPRSMGLGLRGGGWWSRRRGWDDDAIYPTLGQQVAADVVGAAIDALID
ncbi:MAG: hypothetical protein ABIR54_12580 [Burkholderiaceae bacterium]|jgi:hypothetical protein